MISIPTHLKLFAFVLLWHEIARCFDLGANEAFVATLALFFGTAVVRAFRVELVGMGAPLTAAFVTRGALWLVVYLWLTPGLVKALPVSITLAGVVGLAFAGSAARDWFFVWLQNIDGQWLRDRSEFTVGAVMGVLALCFLSSVHWGSVLPLIGCVLLPGLPLSCGWLARTPEAQWRFEANFGTEDMFHDVGASDEV